MRQFSYKQCDKALQKMNKFNKVLNKYSSHANLMSKYSDFNSNNKQNEVPSLLESHTPKAKYSHKKSQEPSYYSIHGTQCKNNANQNKSRKFNLQQFNSNIHENTLGQSSRTIQEKMKNEFFKRQQAKNAQRFQNENKKSQNKLIEKQQNKQVSIKPEFQFKKQKNFTRQKSIDQIDNQINSIMSKYKYDSQQKVQKFLSNKSFQKNNDKISQTNQIQLQSKGIEQSILKNFDCSIQNQNNKRIQYENSDNLHSFQLAKDKGQDKLCQSRYVKKGRSLSNFQEKFKHQFFDKEINVINQKIKKVEQKKKKLKIQFLPFNYQSSKKSNQESSQTQKQIKIKQLLQNYRTLQQYQNYQTGSSQAQKQKTNQYSTISFHEANSQIQQIQENFHKVTQNIQREQSQPKIKIVQSEVKLLQNPQNILVKHVQNLFKKESQSQSFQNDSNKKLINPIFSHINLNDEKTIISAGQNIQLQNIQCQKKLLKNKTQKKLNKSVILVKYQNINQLEKLLTAFHTQIQIDQQLRNEKIKFQYIKDQSKWNFLFIQLKKNQIIMNFQTMKQLFTCSINEHNPFLKFRKNQIYQNCKIDKNNVKNLILKFKEAQNFWNNKICGQFIQKKLYQYRLNEYSLDLQGKNHIAVEDLVRFINMNLNTEYRNRDLILIFNRFLGKDQKQLKFEKFISIITEANLST